MTVVIASSIAVLVIASAGISMYFFQSRAPGTDGMTVTFSTTTINMSTTIMKNDLTSNKTCDNEVWNGSSVTPYDQHAPVLLVQPNSTGYVCVVYESAWHGNGTLFNSSSTYNSYPLLVNGSYQFYPFIVSNYNCDNSTNDTTCTQVISHSFIVNSTPSFIKPSANMTYVTVIYTVSALSNSTGFYDQSAPWTGCIGMPLAVGYTSSEVNSSDFTQQPVHSCFVQLFTPIAEFSAGMGVTYINFTQN